jgi:putative peptidoglycan lipid II flippase
MKLKVIIIILLTILGKITGFAREIVMSARVGANVYTDIYQYANSTTFLLTTVIVTGLRVALIPILSEAELQDRMDSFYNRLLSAFIPLALLSVGILYLASPFLLKLLAPGLTEDMRFLAVTYSRILSINILTISTQALLMGYLQKNNSFYYTASVALPLNFCVIIGILLSNPTNIYPMIIGNVIGQIITIFWLVIPMYKLDFRLALKPMFMLKNDDLGRQFIKMLAPTFIGSIASQLNLIIDRSMASLLPSGSTSHLSYADKLQGIIYSIIVISLITVLFPKQAEYASQKAFSKLFSLTRENVSLMLLIILPLASGMMFLSRELTIIAYMRDQFTLADAIITGNILLCYGGIVIFHSTAEMFSRTLYALKEVRKQVMTSVITVVVNIFFNIILIRPFGVYGLALATTIASFVRLVILVSICKPFYRQYRETLFSKSIYKYIIATFIMIASLIILRETIGQIYGIYMYSLLLIVIGAIVYFSFLLLLRTKEMYQIIDLGTKFFRGK